MATTSYRLTLEQRRAVRALPITDQASLGLRLMLIGNMSPDDIALCMSVDVAPLERSIRERMESLKLGAIEKTIEQESLPVPPVKRKQGGDGNNKQGWETRRRNREIAMAGAQLNIERRLK